MPQNKGDAVPARATAASQSNPQAVSSGAGIPIAPGTLLPWFVYRSGANDSWRVGETIGGELQGIRVADVCPLRHPDDRQADAHFIVHACNAHGALVEALADFCLAAEYWAGCDEGCTPEQASSEIMSSGGAWPAQAYDKARAALTLALGEQS